MKPMAIPTLGGMLVELMTLFIVPVTFSYFEQRKIEQRLGVFKNGKES